MIKLTVEVSISCLATSDPKKDVARATAKANPANGFMIDAVQRRCSSVVPALGDSSFIGGRSVKNG